MDSSCIYKMGRVGWLMACFLIALKRKYELARLKKAYNCVKSPFPLFQIRWLGRLNCVEALVDCRKAVVAYLRDLERLHLAVTCQLQPKKAGLLTFWNQTRKNYLIYLKF